jgi:hypothetical protein
MASSTIPVLVAKHRFKETTNQQARKEANYINKFRIAYFSLPNVSYLSELKSFSHTSSQMGFNYLF